MCCGLSELLVTTALPTISIAVTYLELIMYQTLSEVSVYIPVQLIFKAALLKRCHDCAL